MKNTLEEQIIHDNLQKEKSINEENPKNKREEYSYKNIPENKSSGVQCAFDTKPIDPLTTKLVNEADDYKENSSIDNIIENAEIRENIRLEKPNLVLEDNKNIFKINIYNSEFKGGIEGMGMYKNKIEMKKKRKTPDYMKSTISEQNKILNLKKIVSAKPTLLNNLNRDDNCFTQYKDHKLNFKETQEKFKKFFQIANFEEATQIKYGIVINKKANRKLKSAHQNKDINKSNKTMLTNNHHNPLKNKNDKSLYKIKPNKNYSSTSCNQQYSKYSRSNNNNEDLLKINFDKNLNRNLESRKRNGLLDSCNTSNGFINLGEFNFLERGNLSKHINNPFNSSLKSKDNDSIALILSINKSSNNKFDGSIDHADKKNKHQIYKNLNIIEQKVKENNNKIINENNFSHKLLTKSQVNNFNSITNNSKNIYKILKKERTKVYQKVNFMVENFKASS